MLNIVRCRELANSLSVDSNASRKKSQKSSTLRLDDLRCDIKRQTRLTSRARNVAISSEAVKVISESSHGESRGVMKVTSVRPQLRSKSVQLGGFYNSLNFYRETFPQFHETPMCHLPLYRQ